MNCSRPIFVLIALALSATCLADELSRFTYEIRPKDPDAVLPDTLVLDCSSGSSLATTDFQPFQRNMKVPASFERSTDNEKAVYWPAIRVETNSGSEHDVLFSYIWYGDIETSSLLAYFDDWKIVAEPHTNLIGAEIRSRELGEDDPSANYEIAFLRDGQFLQVSSFVPIDWVSVLVCFR